jgi:hypothetical protein
MPILPLETLPLLAEFAPCFSQPTCANLLRTVGALAPGHISSYRRVLSQDRWSAP